MPAADPLDALLGLERLGIKFGLDNIRALVEALGHPERCCPSIIIAGTNGKGSVAALAEAALGAAGLRTARYTSPHLVRLEERFAILGRPVAGPLLRETAGRVLEEAAALRRSGRLQTEPTFFEVTTAIGFELFRQAGVEVMVLEVGMGGRFDATNVADPLAGAITTIDLDHQAWLGHTIGEIAFEKAGIIKPGMTVVSGESKPEADEVIARVAAERGARLVRARDGARAEAAIDGDRTLVEITVGSRRYGPLPLGLRGRHQADNALVAVRLLESLASCGLAVPAGAIASGLESARWRGRLDLVTRADGRRILFDGAHNPAGARVLADYLAEACPGGAPLVFGVMRDKDAAGMLARLLPRASSFIATRPANPRAADPEAIAEMARRIGGCASVEAEPDPARALERALERGGEAVVAGSLFLVGDLLARVDPSLID